MTQSNKITPATFNPEHVIELLRNQARPINSLGKLDDLAIKLASIYKSISPDLGKAASIVFCADHGVAEEGLSIFPQNVSINISNAFIHGGTAFNVFSKHANLDEFIVDCGLKIPINNAKNVFKTPIRKSTNNFAIKPAMTMQEAIQSIKIGQDVIKQLVNDGYSLFAIGEIGNSNTTSAAAIFSAITGISPYTTSGCGTGIDNATRLRKASTIAKALNRDKPDQSNALECLCSVGGFEIAAMAGAMIEIANNQMCGIVDGYISSVAALTAITISPNTYNNLIFSHQSKEEGHAHLLSILKADPLLNLNLGLGEGTGAILASTLVRLAAAILTEMKSFSSLNADNPYSNTL